MTSLAVPAAGPDHGAFRWTLSFAVVAATHIAAALTLLNSPPSADSGFLAGAAVVMVELPEMSFQMPSPRRDLPLGPEQEQVDETKKETKPPEQVTEMALPQPEPPKLEPEPEPFEKQEATAPPPSMATKPPTAGVETPQPPSPAVQRWQSRLHAKIAGLKRYPPKADARREHGTARVSFRIDDNGRVIESSILESSGWPHLDEEALLAVARAQPFPKPPPGTTLDDRWLIVPMGFELPK
jgi:protein TonB